MMAVGPSPDGEVVVITGVGTGTAPGQTLWTCWRCMTSFTLKPGHYHRCKGPRVMGDVTPDLG